MFIHSSIQQIFIRGNYIPDIALTVITAGDTAVDKSDKSPNPHKMYVLEGEAKQ